MNFAVFSIVTEVSQEQIKTQIDYRVMEDTVRSVKVIHTQ
jgi:hypothetical protein